MQHERLKRLSYWWEEVKANSDNDEAVLRKLHLLEAEIRHTLKAEALCSTQRTRNLWATAMLAGVLILALSLTRMVGIPNHTGRSTVEEVAQTTAGQVTFVKAAESLPTGNTIVAKALEASKHPSLPQRRKLAAVAKSPAPTTASSTADSRPAVAEQPVGSMPITQAATKEEATVPSDPGLNPLELLTALERAFE